LPFSVNNVVNSAPIRRENLWTDANLAALAKCAGLRLVTFDRGFTRFSRLDSLVLQEAAGTTDSG
jgi:predicted nucleic acid-binding protein